MLKQYYKREFENTETDLPCTSCAIAAVVEGENHTDQLSVQDKDLLSHYNTKQKESYLNVKYSDNLSENKLKQLKALWL